MLPRIDWRATLRALGGFLAGLLLWTFLSPLYNGVVAKGAETLIRAFESPKVTRLPAAPAENYVSVERSDFDPRSKRPAIPVHDLTFNIILLTTLFALEARPFSDRNIGGFVVATLLLAVTHVLGLIAEVMSIYALKLGPWSRVNYSAFERNFWGVANHSYRLVLMYAFAFAIWWVCRPSGEKAPAAKRKKR